MDAIALVLIMMELDQVEAWRSKPRAWETYSSWGWGESEEGKGVQIYDDRGRLDFRW